MLVEHARRLTVDQTAMMLRHWLLQADPDREQRERGVGDRLHVSSTFDGTTVLGGVYTSEDGEVVKAAVDAEVRGSGGPSAASGWLDQDRAQRRAAALAEVVQTCGSAPTRALSTVAVTIRLDDLGGGTGQARRRDRRTGLCRTRRGASV